MDGYFTMKFKDLYTFYTAVYRADRSTAVSTNYRYNMDRYILRYAGDNDVADLTQSMLQILLNDMRGRSQTTIRSVYNDLVLVLRHAYIDGHIDKDLSVGLIKPKAARLLLRPVQWSGTPARNESLISSLHPFRPCPRTVGCKKEPGPKMATGSDNPKIGAEN